MHTRHLRARRAAVAAIACLLGAGLYAQQAFPVSRPAAAADSGAIEADGTTPLHLAVRNGSLTKVQALIRAKADVNAANRYGVTPLELAATYGDAQILEALLKAGANPNSAYGNGQTPLMAAARSGSREAVLALVARGANVNSKEWLGETALMLAAAEDHGSVVKTLVELGADLNAKSNVTDFPEQKFTTSGMVTTYLNRGGWTALMFASRQDSKDAVRNLIAAKADLDLVDDDGATAMSLAVINGHFDTATLLLNAGADPNIGDKTGMAALYATVDMNTLGTMFGRPTPKFPRGEAVTFAKALIAKGANTNQQLKTPILQRYHNAGDQQLGEGATPLIRAARAGDMDMFGLLLDSNAKCDLALKDGTNALMTALNINGGAGVPGAAADPVPGADSKALAAVRLCIDHGSDVNAARANGQTAMHTAAGVGADDVIRLLASKGAKLDAKDAQGLTPLDFASGQGARAAGRRAGAGNAARNAAAAPAAPNDSTIALIKELMAKS